MKKPKLRELKEAIIALVKGPYTTDFPFGPPPIQETFRGKPVYHEEDCIGCGACAEVCPPHAIEVSEIMRDGKIFRKLNVFLDVCVYCGTCVEKCTTQKGITQSADFDISGLNRHEFRESVEKEMVVCELCSKAFAAKDHLKWIYNRIGTLAATNWTLMLVGQEELGVTGTPAERKKTKMTRADQMRILCPECRKNVILADEWGSFV